MPPFICALVLLAQDVPATFSTRVNLITVPVVVRDKDGRSLANLKKDDFRIFDQGRERKVTQFTVEEGAQVVEEGGSAVPVTAEAPASRFIAYLVDDIHITQIEMKRIRDAALAHVDESLHPGDRAAIFTTSTVGNVEFTADKAKLRAGLEALISRRRASYNMQDCPAIDEYQASLIINGNDLSALNRAAGLSASCGNSTNRARQEMYVRDAAARIVSMTEVDSRNALAALRDAIVRMSTLPGRRAIVLISSGFIVSLDRQRVQAELTDMATRARVTVNALDARGMNVFSSGPGSASRTESAMAMGDVMREFADNTGGKLFNNSDDFLGGLRRVAEWPAFTYTLGFVPDDLKYDGSFHKLKIEVAARNVDLQVRKGYYDSAHPGSTAELAKEEMGVDLFSRREEAGLPVKMELMAVKTGANAAKLSVISHTDFQRVQFQKEGGANRATLTMAAAVFNPDGALVATLQKDFNLNLSDARLAAAMKKGVALPLDLDVAPGKYTVRLVVRDKDGHTAAQNGSIQVQ